VVFGFFWFLFFHTFSNANPYLLEAAVILRYSSFLKPKPFAMLTHILNSYFLFQLGYSSPELSFLQFLLLLLLVLFLGYIAGKIKRQAFETERWFQGFTELHLSAQDFYKTLESCIKDMQMPGVKMRRVRHPETGFLSADREYLRVSYQEQVFDVCAAPLGHSFFISYWQVDTATIIRKLVRAIPKIGPVLEIAIFGKTYYQVDSADMFKQFIDKLLEDTVELLTKEQAVRGYKELEVNSLEAQRPN
jgi:hypothetical protein